MNMDDQVIQHIMHTQTQLLNSVLSIQQERKGVPLTQPAVLPMQGVQPPQGEAHANTPFGTAKPSHIASTAIPPSTPAIPPIQGQSMNPNLYGAVANPYTSEGRQPLGIGSHAKGLIAGTIEEMRSFNAMGHSKESTDRYITEQARGFQERAVDTAGGVATGITGAASMLVPGFAPAVAVGVGAAALVGGTTKIASEQTRIALDYQDTLQQSGYKFINAFESTNDMGGIGMGLEDRQEISRFLREMGPQEFLDDADLNNILQGAADNSLMKSVSDVKSFKDKFSSIVDAVKEITVTLNASIEEATAFMGEMERRGVTTSDMGMIAAQAKVSSSFTGKDAQQTLQTMLQTSDAITAGTAIDATDVLQATSENMFMVQNIQDQGGEMLNYIKNSGGATQVGANYEQNIRNYANSQQGQQFLVGMLAPAFQQNEEGGFTLNQDIMSGILNSDASAQQLTSQSSEYFNSLPLDQQRRLATSASAIFNREANSRQMTDFAVRAAQSVVDMQADRGIDVDLESALLDVGAAGDYEEATLITEMYNQQNDPEQLQAYRARVLKEQMDSNAISDSPGLGKRIGYWFERNIENPVGNVAQDFSDTIGSYAQDYQKFITGLDDRSVVNAGADLPELNQGALTDFANESMEKFNENQRRINELENEFYKDDNFENFDPFKGWARRDTDLDRGTIDEDRAQKYMFEEREESYTSAEADVMENHLEAGNLVGQELLEVQAINESSGYWSRDKWRTEMTMREATGEYDGIVGGIREGVDTAEMWMRDVGGGIKDWVLSEPDEFKKTDALTDFDIEEETETLRGERQDLQQELNKLITSDESFKDMDKETLQTLQNAIRSGDTDTVTGITGKDDAKDLADRYSNLLGREETFGEQQSLYRQTSEMTAVYAKSGQSLGDLFKASGVYSEAQIDDYFGELKDLGKETTKDLKEGDLGYIEMVKASDEMEAEISNIFSGMVGNDSTRFAEYLVSQANDPELTVEDFMMDGSTVIDTQKLQEYATEMIRSQNIDPNKDKKKNDGETEEEAKEVTNKHAKAMETYLNTMTSEMAMLRDAAGGRQVSYSNSTSLSTGE